MHKLIISIFTVMVIAWAGGVVFLSAADTCEHLWVLDYDLWLTRGDEGRLVITDPCGVLFPRWSHTGERIAYAHDFRFDEIVRSEIIVIGENGKVLRTLPIPRETEVNAIMQIGWRDERHLFAEGHVNPSTAKYLEWDIDSGHLVDEKTGSWFAISSNGRFVAQRAHVPYGAPPPYNSSILLINDTVVYPQKGDNGYHRFAAGLIWSTDGNRLAFVDGAETETNVVVVNAATGAIRHARVASKFTPTELLWSDTNTIIVRGSDEIWRVDTVTGKAQAIKDFPILTKHPAIPSVLGERFQGMSARLEDTRCKP